MSNAVRQSVQTVSDRTEIANLSVARSNAELGSLETETRPGPILIGADSARAFDLFQPEAGEFSTEEFEPFAAEFAPSGVGPTALSEAPIPSTVAASGLPVAPFAPSATAPIAPAAPPMNEWQRVRLALRAVDATRSATTTLNLPLGGVAPTDREVAAARALIVGWIAACGIALFAFLAQGPTVRTGRIDEPTPPAATVDQPPAGRARDIRLDPAASAKPAPPQAKKRTRDPAPAAAVDKPQPTERR